MMICMGKSHISLVNWMFQYRKDSICFAISLYLITSTLLKVMPTITKTKIERFCFKQSVGLWVYEKQIILIKNQTNDNISGE